ncbi:ABC transporter substrate-binding protein [Marinomonas spartinae]|uniref:ABC transporter substrate-binding protein n=1 Tax=Marinomonas spartinae TaxID=1792290 RepID=UPI0018F1B418|nr:PotD/PotF family extracellular solute-binding protein [Marinomonas spartinae]MBJ7555510.1 extracellular solute-binding protein [Marinomonas spartinae]
MNRRRFLQLSAIFLGNAAFSRQAFAQPLVLRYLCWDGYDLPALLNEFEHLNKCDVLSEVINDSPAAYVKLSGEGHLDYDVTSIDSPWLERLDREGSLATISDSLRQSRYEQYYPQFREQFLPKQNPPRNWLPTRWGWIGPTINTAYVKEEDYQSYAPCFARKNRGKIGVMDWGDWPILPIALYLGIDPYQPLDKYALETLRQAFRALFKNQPIFVPDISIGQKGIVDGSLKTIIGAGTYLTSALRRAGFSQIKTVLPVPRNGLKQGIIWTEGSAAMKGNPNEALAMKLVEYTTSIHASYILSYLGATCNLTPNIEVEKMYSAKQRASLQVDDVAYVLKNSLVNRTSPDIGQMLQIWQSELFKAS